MPGNIAEIDLRCTQFYGQRRGAGRSDQHHWFEHWDFSLQLRRIYRHIELIVKICEELAKKNDGGDLPDGEVYPVQSETKRHISFETTSRLNLAFCWHAAYRVVYMYVYKKNKRHNIARELGGGPILECYSGAELREIILPIPRSIVIKTCQKKQRGWLIWLCNNRAF